MPVTSTGLSTLLQAGRELGLAGETLHDAAQLLDRAGCLGLLPAPAPPSPGSDGSPTDGAAGPVAPPDVALVGAALLIACKSRAHLACPGSLSCKTAHALIEALGSGLMRVAKSYLPVNTAISRR